MSEMPYENQVSLTPKRVYFTGITALVHGQGVCYDRDYAVAAPPGRAATDPSGYRDRRVELPSATNNMWFAGVTARAYAASPTGRWIEIFEPGSVCEVATLPAAVAGETMLTCIGAGPAAGWFAKAGFPGRGSALALQTTLTPTVLSTQPAPVGESLDASASIAADGITITKTDLFLLAKPGDKVIVLAGSTTASGAATVVPGIYTLATRTDKDTGVLTAGSAVAAAVSRILCYVVRGNPTVLCKLMDGEESGLTDYVSTKTAVEVVPAALAGGTTFVQGGVTIAGDCTFTIVNAVKGIRRKAISQLGTLITKNITVTPTAGNITGMLVAGTFAAITTYKLLLASGSARLEWDGARWGVVGGLGTAA